jgi:two-component system cell cycle sensor histidine kinase/response regulator CckA
VLDDLASRSDAAMRVLFDGAESGLLLIDRAGRVVRTNAALRATVAAGVDLAAGAAAARIFTPDERAGAWAKIQALLSGRSSSCRLTAQLLLADPASDRRADIGCRLIREANGTISGLLLRITDITAQVRLEAELAQSRELEAVGHLVGGVAHDFNNLLTAIMGAVELAQDRAPDAPFLTELDHIRRSAERGAALVRNLLALGRQQYLQATPIDTNTALREFADVIRPALAPGVTLDLALEEPGRRVRVDPGQLDQVLTNLVMNANHAMPRGGRLTLRSGRATLYRKQVHGRETIPAGRYVVVSVQDTGTGIRPELMDRIFDPFFTTRRAQGGSGLGLATAHGIIRQSGGFLTVESELGRGTIFRIHLPREEAAPIPADPPPAPPPAAGAPPPPAPAAPPPVGVAGGRRTDGAPRHRPRPGQARLAGAGSRIGRGGARAARRRPRHRADGTGVGRRDAGTGRGRAGGGGSGALSRSAGDPRVGICGRHGGRPKRDGGRVPGQALHAEGAARPAG